MIDHKAAMESAYYAYKRTEKSLQEQKESVIERHLRRCAAFGHGYSLPTGDVRRIEEEMGRAKEEWECKKKEMKREAKKAHKWHKKVAKAKKKAAQAPEADTRFVATAKTSQLIQALPQELYDLILDFTLAYTEHRRPTIVEIDEHYKPPALSQIDRASRHHFSKLYYSRIVFSFANLDVGLLWLKSLHPKQSLQVKFLRHDTRLRLSWPWMLLKHPRGSAEDRIQNLSKKLASDMILFEPEDNRSKFAIMAYKLRLRFKRDLATNEWGEDVWRCCMPFAE
ncbi:unnamed protein product [Zymoseptoria tritici ST99CH_1A5]|uniref:Uncharacterized protein n=3 Tax=Zymoseptoria tritici TaxID=1047171 RepID=A0A1X7S2L1_ZYMT9|nr:unnamed protein product [Zymoseptoria tritici ST99CH_3D7]SMR58350.1 unnamed protein product [Zymoseptoria tritici ST99CH_1E4]SMY27551.1 unnamed protein product [Zymoseptoria tritici ST99CH_1A5]